MIPRYKDFLAAALTWHLEWVLSLRKVKIVEFPCLISHYIGTTIPWKWHFSQFWLTIVLCITLDSCNLATDDWFWLCTYSWIQTWKDSMLSTFGLASITPKIWWLHPFHVTNEQAVVKQRFVDYIMCGWSNFPTAHPKNDVHLGYWTRSRL